MQVTAITGQAYPTSIHMFKDSDFLTQPHTRLLFGITEDSRLHIILQRHYRRDFNADEISILPQKFHFLAQFLGNLHKSTEFTLDETTIRTTGSPPMSLSPNISDSREIAKTTNDDGRMLESADLSDERIEINGRCLSRIKPNFELQEMPKKLLSASKDERAPANTSRTFLARFSDGYAQTTVYDASSKGDCSTRCGDPQTL